MQSLRILTFAVAAVALVAGCTPKPAADKEAATSPAPSGKETPRQWFDRVYLVAKSDALGELP